MKKYYRHTIDFLFPITLFFVFASTALIVVLLAANLYQKQVDRSETSFRQGTALSYLKEKIRQNDHDASNICITTFDGLDALSISQNYDGTSYTTYIYALDGMLTEIFLKSGAEASAAGGTSVMAIESLKMQELQNGCFRFICTSEDGASDSVIIYTRSQ